MRLNQNEENDEKKKGVGLKASSSIQDESDKEDLNEIEEDDDFSLFVKRFNKFLRNKGNQRRTNFNSKKKGEYSSFVPKCYECNQPGHLRSDCPIFKRRMKNPTREISKKRKKYITWEDNDMDSSSDSEKEVVNLSLMAKSYFDDAKDSSQESRFKQVSRIKESFKQESRFK